MKILLVTQYFWPETFCINELASALVGQGHEIEVLTGIPNYPEGRFFKGYGLIKREANSYHGITIRRVPHFPRFNGCALGLCLNYASFVFFACILGPLLCRKQYDIVFVYEPSPITVGLPALLLKWIKGCPLLFWVQDLWPESLSATGAVKSQKILSAVGRLVRFIYRHCDKILVQSRAFVQSITAFGIASEKIVYFPNLVNSHFRPLAPESCSQSAVPKGFVLMFAGNIGAAQDFPTIIATAEMLKEHRDIHFVILGSGRMLEWVQEIVRQRKLESTVHLLGRYPNEVMPQFYSQADAMLVTLKREPIFELTVPAKVQAYLACGRPIIAAIGGETARIIDESGAGMSCEAENPTQLRDAILALYNKSADERMHMGNLARQYFEEHFDSSKLLERFEVMMREMGKQCPSQEAAASAP